MHAISLSYFQINSLSFTIISDTSSQKTKEKIQGLESELFKSNLLLKKQDLEINNLQKIIAKQRETSNNTSNSFLLSSEFKKEWIDLGTTVIMESFEHVFNRSLLLSNMVQETFLITFTETKKLIHDKVSHIMEFFNITSDYEKFAMKIKPFFEEYFISIFFGNKTENESLVNSILTTLSNNILNKSICKYFHKEIQQDIQSENIKNFINKSIRLCLYMHLHSPVLNIKISPFDNREPIYYYFNHIDHVNIEGFERENSPCLVILPPPLLSSGFSFQGIKPFVYIIADPDEKIFEKCEINKKESLLSRRIHSKSYGGEEYRKKKEEKTHQEEIPIEDEEYSIEGRNNSKKMNLSDRSPEKKDTLFQLSSSSSEEEEKKNSNINDKYSDNVDNKVSNITDNNTAKNENLNPLLKKDNIEIIPFTEKPNSRNKSTTPSIPIGIQKENPLMNKTTCGNIHYSSNANMTVYVNNKTQSKESKEVNRISQILFNICHHTTLNTPPSSSSSSLSKPKKERSKLPPNSKRITINGINSSLISTKSRNSQAVLSRTKTHQQSSSVNRGTNPLMNNNLSFFEKEGSNYDYICKTIDQQANGVSVKPVIIKESVSKENRSEKPRKKKSMHIISNNPLTYRVKRHNGECCLRNNINNKNKDKNNISNNNNSSVKFNSNNIDNCLNNKGLVKGVINRKIVRAKKTCFTNDLLSCYNNSTISNHSELNGNGTVKLKKKSDI